MTICDTGIICLPVEIFLGIIGLALSMAIVGFIRQPQIPAMLVFGGIFILFVGVMVGGIIMGKVPTDATDTSSTNTAYTYEDNVFDFRGFPQMMFGLMGAICMLTGGLMVRGN